MKSSVFLISVGRTGGGLRKQEKARHAGRLVLFVSGWRAGRFELGATFLKRGQYRPRNNICPFDKLHSPFHFGVITPCCDNLPKIRNKSSIGELFCGALVA